MPDPRDCPQTGSQKGCCFWKHGRVQLKARGDGLSGRKEEEPDEGYVRVGALCGAGRRHGADRAWDRRVVGGSAHVSLPDGRTYELVSPIANPTIKVNVLPLARVSSDGNAVAFQTWGDRSVGPSDNLETYVSTRGPSGWTPKLITPPGLPRPDFDPAFEITSNPFFAFNSDLSQALFDTMPMPTSPLVPGEPGPNSGQPLRAEHRQQLLHAALHRGHPAAT